MPFDGVKEVTQTEQDLLAAADLLERMGWCKYAMRDLNGAYCVRGALIAVISCRVHPGSLYAEPDLELREKKAVHLILSRLGIRDNCALALENWNDKSGTTLPRVLQVLRGWV